MTNSHSVKIFTTPTCVYCKMAKEYFKKNNVSYEEYDVGPSGDPTRRQELIQKSGQLAVPLIEIDGKIILGFDKKRIDESLGLGN